MLTAAAIESAPFFKSALASPLNSICLAILQFLLRYLADHVPANWHSRFVTANIANNTTPNLSSQAFSNLGSGTDS
jgi:hypothetical protein